MKNSVDDKCVRRRIYSKCQAQRLGSLPLMGLAFLPHHRCVDIKLEDLPLMCLNITQGSGKSK